VAESINLRLPLKIIGGDGTVLFSGSGLFGIVYTARVVNATVLVGDGVAIDPTTFIIVGGSFVAAVDTGAPAENVYTCRKMITTGNFDRGIMGVAITSAPVGSEIAIAGIGSIALVNVAASTGTLGQFANPTTTAGLAVSSTTALTAPQEYLGKFWKPSGSATPTGGATDTGSASKAAVLVNPGSKSV
jgi:hypothetical protein